MAFLITGFNVVSNAQPNKATHGSESFDWQGEFPCIEDEYLYGTVTMEWVERMVDEKYTGHARMLCDFAGFPSGKKYEVKQMNNDIDNFNNYLVGTHTIMCSIWLEDKKIGMIKMLYHHNIDYIKEPWEWMNDIELLETKCF